MVGCTAYQCKSRSEKKTPGVTFHRFPHDPEKQKLWLENMKLTGWAPTLHDRLCSNHFEKKWFYQTHQKKMKLLNEAVPTIFSELPYFYYLQVKKETEIHRAPLKEPVPSTSTATDFAADTPNEKRLRKRLFDEMEKSRQKSKRLKVLQQSLKRCKRRILTLKQMVTKLEKRNLMAAENMDPLQEFSNCDKKTFIS